MQQWTLERADATDLAAVSELLTELSLPPDDLGRHLATTIVARQDGRILGSVAVEIYADGGLLRSVAVSADAQGQGLGRALTDAALGLARESGVRTLYLLTTTADAYFPKFGFERIARTDVPASVQASVEFTTACPSSATVMRKRL